MKQVIDSLSLVVPAYNEEEVIFETLKIYNKKLARIARRYEIIVVDDGSTDLTPQILKKINVKNPHLKIITHKKNLGVGKTLLDGLRIAKYQWVMHNSADQPFNIDDLQKIKNLFKTSDVIVAVRKDRSANSLFRKLTSLTSLLLIKLFFGTHIKDFHFIQIYKTKILKGVKVTSNDTFMPAELLVNLARKNYTIAQFTAKFYKRTAGYSKYDNPLRYLVYLRELVKFWWRLNH